MAFRRYTLFTTLLLLFSACNTESEWQKAQEESDWWCKFYGTCDGEDNACSLYGNCGGEKKKDDDGDNGGDDGGGWESCKQYGNCED